MSNLVWAFFLFFLLSWTWSVAADNCVNCHTKPGELINITRQLEKPKIEQSAETKGEG